VEEAAAEAVQWRQQPWSQVAAVPDGSCARWQYCNLSEVDKTELINLCVI